MRTPGWEDGTLLYRPTPYEFDGTRRVQAYGDQTLWTLQRPTPWFAAGSPGATDLVTDLRRQAWEAARRPYVLGEAYQDTAAIGFLGWVGKTWVVPFPSLERARAYFDRAQTLGIDYTYAATFDTSDPRHPRLVWEQVGDASTSAAVAGSITGSAWEHVTMPEALSALTRLSHLVEQHHRFWSRIAADDSYAAAWIDEHWYPWYESWKSYLTTGRPPKDQVVRGAQELSNLRQRAEASGVPIPDLGTARRGFAHVPLSHAQMRDVLEYPAPGSTPGRTPLTHAEMREVLEGERPMSDLIGRRGGGGGGGGGGRGFRGLGRRGFGGWGGWDGYPGYYEAYPWWVYGAPGTYGDPNAESPGDVGDDAVSGAEPAATLPARDDLRAATDVLAPGQAGLSCQMNLGSDLVLRASICIDGRCYQGAADLSRLLHEIHARLHGWDVTPDVVGWTPNQPRRPRRHRPHRHRHHHRRDPQRDQDQDQDRDQDQDQDGGSPGFAPGGWGGWGGQGGYAPPSYAPPYPYPPAPPYPYPPVAPPVAPIVQPIVQPIVAPAAPVEVVRDHRGHGRHGGAPEDAATSARQAAVQSSGDLLIGVLCDQHRQEVAAGWLDRISDAFAQGSQAVAKTIQKFKGPITIAAVAVAKEYGGEDSGRLAGQLTGPVIDAAASDGDKRERARAVLAIAQNASQSQPQIAAALAVAQTAAAQTAAAYHVTSTAIDALRGDPEAQRKVDRLRQDAASGDSAAQRALDLVTRALQSMAGAPGGDPTTSTIALTDAPALPTEAQVGAQIGAKVARISSALRAEASAAVLAAAQATRATAIGFCKDASGQTSTPVFRTLDDADDWLGGLDPHTFVYAAYFDAADPTWPSPINEQLGAPAHAAAVSGGVGLLPWLGLGALAAGGAYWWWKHRHPHHPPPHGASHDAPPPSSAPPTGQGSATTTSGEIEHTKADAVAAVLALHRIVGASGVVYFGYALQRVSETKPGASGHTSVTVMDSANSQAFSTEAEMWAWYHGVVADPASYEFVALFNATKTPWPRPFLAHEAPANPGRVVPSPASDSVYAAN